MKRFVLLFFVVLLSFSVFANDLSRGTEDFSIEEFIDILKNDCGVDEEEDVLKDSLLLYATKYGHRDIVYSLLDDGVLWFDKASDLIYNSFANAIVAGDFSLVKAFVDSGLDVNKAIFDDINLLFLATTFSNDVDIVDFLVDSGAFFYTRNVSSINKMTGANASEYGTEFLNYLIGTTFSGNSEILAYLLDFVKNDKSLNKILKDYFSLVKKGMFKDDVFVNALQFLPKRAFFIITNALVDLDFFNEAMLKAIVKTDKLLIYRDRDDSTLIHYLAKNYKGEFLPLMKILISGNYNLDYSSLNGDTPLLFSAQNKFEKDRFKLFIEQGCDVGVKNIDGVTIFEFLAENNSYENFLFALNKSEKKVLSEIFNVERVVDLISKNEEFYQGYYSLPSYLIKNGFIESIDDFPALRKLEFCKEIPEEQASEKQKNTENLENLEKVEEVSEVEREAELETKTETEENKDTQSNESETTEDEFSSENPDVTIFVEPDPLENPDIEK